MVYVLVIIFGMLIGSFINALQFRIEQGLEIKKGRSFCPNCKHALSWDDLVPVFSYILLRGKCRYCNKKISIQYPIVEIITGLGFFVVWNILKLPNSLDGLVTMQSANFGLLIKASLLFIVSSIAILIGLHDKKTGFVLSSYVYTAIVLSLVTNFFGVGGEFISLVEFLPYIYSLLGASFFFGSLYIASKGKWMGAGDIEIAALMGALLGWPSIITALYFAFISGSVVGLIKIYNKNANLKSEMPFGPFLIAGTFFAMMFSDKIIEIYAKLILGS